MLNQYKVNLQVVGNLCDHYAYTFPTPIPGSLANLKMEVCNYSMGFWSLVLKRKEQILW